MAGQAGIEPAFPHRLAGRSNCAVPYYPATGAGLQFAISEGFPPYLFWLCKNIGMVYFVNQLGRILSLLEPAGVPGNAVNSDEMRAGA